jgi:hypothetical protein
MTTFKWEAVRLDCHPQSEGQTDVVFTVHWRCVGTDGNYTGAVYSTCNLPSPTESFTPYADLTLNQVLGWIWANGVDQAATEAAAQAQIDNQKTPPVVTPPLPWTN